MYLFQRREALMGGKLGASHGAEMPFVFRNVDASANIVGVGDDRHRLEDQISGAWLAFAHKGDPNHPGLPHWAAYDAKNRTTMVFDSESRAVDDPGRDDRIAMQALPGKV